MLRRVAMMAALAALLAPAGMAEAAKKKKKKKPPVVTSISPSNVAINETLTIRGRYFRRGVGRNSVAFRRDGSKAIIVRADISTAKMLKVVVSERLADYLFVRDGVAQPTKFRVRVLARRFGKRFTALSKSPTIHPAKPEGAAADQPPPAAPDGDCDGDQIKNSVDTDDDNDLLTDDVEKSIGTDGCNRDTDGDKIEDGYEYQAAKDLNSTYRDGYLPYPGKKPYPNPLFADANTDYDGDGLWLVDEFGLWQRFGVRDLNQPLIYSDGRQHSRNIAPMGYDKQGQFLADAGLPAEKILNFDAIVPHFKDYTSSSGDEGFYTPNPAVTDVERFYYDRDYNGRLSDDELDEDADGLANWEEAHGPMRPEWWPHNYQAEKTYVIAYAGTEMLDRDSDGDGVIDGVDDVDHDGIINVHEVARQLVAGEVKSGFDFDDFSKDEVDNDEDGETDEADEDGPMEPYVTWTYGTPYPPTMARRIEGTSDAPYDDSPRRAWTQPFNPCLPDHNSETCERHPNLDQLYAPFLAGVPVFSIHEGVERWPE